MEIVERMENKLLNRVEIKFSWRHSGKAHLRRGGFG